MKSLQQYIYESYEDINEGKIFDAIKNWFKKLFEPTDKTYDRYTNHGKYISEHPKEYNQYLSKNFKWENVVTGSLDDNQYELVHKENPEFNIEFKKDKYYDYDIGFFTDKEVRDICYIIELKETHEEDNYIGTEILNIQIAAAFKPYIKLENIFDILTSTDKQPKYTKIKLNLHGKARTFIQKKNNEELYKSSLTFGFKKGTYKGNNISYYITNKEDTWENT
jgi:hypothetical protein